MIGDALGMAACVAVVGLPVLCDGGWIAELATREAEIELRSHPVTKGAGTVAVAHRFHWRRKLERGIELAQQALNLRFRFLVKAFAEMVVAKLALRIDEVFRRPIAIRVGAPDDIAIVEDHWVFETKLPYRRTNIRVVASKAEFRCMHADDDDSVFAIARMPTADAWQRGNAIATGVIPEVAHTARLTTKL